MISNLDPTAQKFLADLNRVQTRTNIAQGQISSGFRIQTASDAPDEIGSLLQLEADLSSNTQARANLSRAKAEADTGESVLGSAIQALDKAVQIGAQGAGIQTAQERAGLAQQIQNVQQQLVSLTGTSVEGRYIFSGSADSQPPYQLNLANPNGVDRLVTTSATRQIQDTTGNSFPVARTAQDIFDHRNPDDTLAGDNVFAALNSLRVALAANDSTGITTAIDALHRSSAYLNDQQSFYGETQDRLNTAISTGQDRDTTLKSQISNIRDADLTEASLTLNAGITQQQASLAARAKTPVRSLFDFLA